jgi:glycosidase
MRLRVWLSLVTIALGAACATIPDTSSSAGGEWLQRPVIYEVFTRDFSPAGDFQGVIDGLDRIRAMNVNVIWLMPIHPVGLVNRKGLLGSSYSVRDYRAINSDYGTEADFRRLVSAVHARGMKIIIDWVPNHTAWDHVWMTSNPERYTRVNGEVSVPRDNDGKPTDWTDVADLNYHDPGLRRAMIADMKYWLDRYDLDGYRVDVAGFVPDDFWQEALPALRADRKPILLLAEWGDPKMHALGFDLSYGWDAYGRLKGVWKGESAAAFIENEVKDLAALPNQGRRMRFTTNHDETAWDQPPIALFGGPAGARAAFTAMALLPGAPLLYNGQEVESPQKLGLFVQEPVNWVPGDTAAARAFYRRVLQLATSHPAFAVREIQPVQTDAADDVIAYRRGNALVLVNARPRARAVQVRGVSVNGARELLYGRAQSGERVELGPYGALVFELP